MSSGKVFTKMIDIANTIPKCKRLTMMLASPNIDFFMFRAFTVPMTSANIKKNSEVHLIGIAKIFYTWANRRKWKYYNSWMCA